MDAYVTPTKDRDYSCHIKAIELNQSYRGWTHTHTYTHTDVHTETRYALACGWRMPGLKNDQLANFWPLFLPLVRTITYTQYMEMQ